MDPTPRPAELPLVAGQRLEVCPAPWGQLLRILAPDGEARLTIEVTAAGPVLRLHGSGLALVADGDLMVEGERVQIHARDSLELSSGRGDVAIKANDDVKIAGERVRVNC